METIIMAIQTVVLFALFAIIFEMENANKNLVKRMTVAIILVLITIVLTSVSLLVEVFSDVLAIDQSSLLIKILGVILAMVGLLVLVKEYVQITKSLNDEEQDIDK